jgi:hypothetical protein
MTVLRTILLCFLCGRPQHLVVSLYPGASLGSPRFWCADCLRPRNFSKRLRERLALLESQGTPLGDDALLFNALGKLLSIEQAFEEDRARVLAA